MFTGIIEEVGFVEEAENLDGGKEFAISCSFAGDLNIDQSISINGVCHTVVETAENTFSVQSVEETLRKSNMADLKTGDPVNLERSMTMESLLDGHIVQGHVDGIGRIDRIEKEGTDWLVTVQYPKTSRNLIVGRGSIAVDGISLTVADVDSSTFKVAVIPYTYDNTNMKDRSAGDSVNLEFDIIGKYVARHLENRNGNAE